MIKTANKLKSYFSSIGEDVSNPFDIVTENSRSTTSVSSSLIFRNISVGEVERIVKGMKSKPCDISTYPVKALKFIIDVVSPVLLITINRSL